MNAKPAPWYAEKSMWLVVALPLAAILASIVTLWLVLAHPDREVFDLDRAAAPHNSVTPPAR